MKRLLGSQPTNSLMHSAWKSGPVRSLAYFWKDRDRDRSINILRPSKTGLDRLKPIFRSFAVLGPVRTVIGFWSVLNRSFGYFCIGKNFWTDLVIILSPKTSKMVGNWWSYEGFKMFSLFKPAFDKALNILLSFSSIYMNVSSFWRGNWRVQETGSNRFTPVQKDRSFCGL